jgi:hypothetical protein
VLLAVSFIILIVLEVARARAETGRSMLAR